MLFTNLNSMRGTGGRLKDEWDDGEKWNEDFFWWYDGWGDDDEIWLMRWMIHEMEMRNDKMEDARMDAWNRLMMVKYDAMIWWGRMMPWTYPQTLSLL